MTRPLWGRVILLFRNLVNPDAMTHLEKSRYIELKQAVYREYSRSYDEDRDRFVSGDALLQRIDWALAPSSPGGNLLDLGCGSGQLLARATERADGKGLLAGLDLTPDMLALAKSGLDGGVTLVEGDATLGLPFKDASFDLVTSLNLVQELPADAIPDLFDDVHRVLRLGGLFRAVIPCMADSPASTAKNEAADMFRKMAQVRSAMEFRYARELEESLLSMPGFVEKQASFLPSPAAANAAKGEPRFTMFTDILNDIESLGLDPGQVRQGVIFFSGRRGPDS